MKSLIPRMTMTLAAGAGCVLCCTLPAQAGSVLLQASADNTLYEDINGLVSNGQGESFFAGRTALEELRRGLLRFDFSAIPAGSTITGVTLTLTCTRSISLAEEVSLHRSLVSWGEGASNALGEGGRGAPAQPGDATWLHRFSDATAWTSTGGDFVAAASATTAVSGNGRYIWASAGMISDVQGWLNDASGNYGWFVLGAESITGSAKRFATRENTDATLRPTLEVSYVIPAPGTAAVLLSSLMLATQRRRRQTV